jgi:hypothetical protein
MNREEAKTAKLFCSSRGKTFLRGLRSFAVKTVKLARLTLIFFTMLAWMLLAEPVSAQAPGSQVTIISPQPGEALQGQVTINGNSDVAGFVSAEIAFAYSDDPTGTWFLIAAGNQPVRDGVLAVWDTTTITDGLYTLRLSVILGDGSQVDVTVPALRVRNYTPVETAIASSTSLEPAPIASVTLVAASATPFPTPTSLPPNPAALTPSRIYASLGYGALAVLAILLLLALYLRLRRT